jgi:hypothetical protein
MSPQSPLIHICARGHMAVRTDDPRAWDPCAQSAAVVLLALLAFFLIVA